MSPLDSQKSEKTLINVLSEKSNSITPIWLMRQAGRYLPEYRQLRLDTGGFLDLCYTPNLASKVTLQPIKRFDLDAAIIFSDILVIPDALGQKVSFEKGNGPKLDPMTLNHETLLKNKDKFLSHLEPVYESIRMVSKELSKDRTLIGFAGAPWTIATYMIEGGPTKTFSKVKAWSYKDPERFGKFIDGLVEAIILHLKNQIDAGAEVIQIFDSWAGVLSPDSFHKWVIEPTVKIVESIKRSNPNIPIIGFPRGAGVGYVSYVKETMVDGISLDTTVPTSWAVKNIPEQCTLQGNLDPDILINGGKQMVDQAFNILHDLSNRSHIFNLGHGVLPDTPPDNVKMLIEVVHRYRN